METSGVGERARDRGSESSDTARAKAESSAKLRWRALWPWPRGA